MASRENNTMAEGCDKLLKQIASMEQEPDADMEFLGALRGDILTYLKPPTPSAPSSPDQQLAGAMGQVSRVGAGPMPMGATAPDEMRRMVSPS